MTALIDQCPACGDPGLTDFHQVPRVPTNSCLLLNDLEDVKALPDGELRLAVCHACGFITNRAFDPGLPEYSARYEETQAYSERFVTWARDLARRWVDEHDLQGRTVIEIGCGKGEFLEYMVDAGVAGGVGIDPGVDADRRNVPSVDWVADFFTADYGQIHQDAVVCRHTLEHIHPVKEFLLGVRRAIGDRSDIRVLFEVPDVLRVLQEGAFWDLYYEHCSYFTPGSLVRLFRRCGFTVDDVSLDYDGQYILLAARPSVGNAEPSVALALEDDLAAVKTAVQQFPDLLNSRLAETRTAVDQVTSDGGHAVLWGAGSKGVSYLGALGQDAQIHYAVDINPHKHGRYVAGAGQQIVPPTFLKDYDPSLVIAMNPVYVEEIGHMLRQMDVDARLMAV